MNTTSKIYMGDDGNYHDKTEAQRREQEELAARVPEGEPVPFDADGEIAGEEIVDSNGDAESELTGDGSGQTLPDAPAPKSAKASTRKQ